MIHFRVFVCRSVCTTFFSFSFTCCTSAANYLLMLPLLHTQSQSHIMQMISNHFLAAFQPSFPSCFLSFSRSSNYSMIYASERCTQMIILSGGGGGECIIV